MHDPSDETRPVHPFDTEPIIGMVHLRPLPGTMYYDGDIDAVIDAALRDAVALQSAGFDGLIVENFGDVPFRKESVEPHTVAAMTAAVREIFREVDIPIGLNVLRNDPFAAVAVASATGAGFIRVNVLSGVMVTDQGIIEGRGAELLAYLDRIAPELAIYADVNVKHAKPLVSRPPEEVAIETMERGGAHALIVTGSQTGRSADLRELGKVRSAVAGPVLVGSGVTPENIAEILAAADGVIVGSSIKENGRAPWPVDPDRAAALIEEAR